jgi:hypothetical protein
MAASRPSGHGALRHHDGAPATAEIFKAQQLLGFLPTLVFIVYIGIGYFGSEYASGEWERYVLRATIAGLFGISWLVMLAKFLYLMTTRNLSGNTRARILLNHLAQSASILLLVSVFVWASGPAVEAITYVIGAYLLLVVIIPFFVGVARSKRWAEALEERRAAIARQLTESLRQGNVATALSGVAAGGHREKARCPDGIANGLADADGRGCHDPRTL